MCVCVLSIRGSINRPNAISTGASCDVVDSRVAGSCLLSAFGFGFFFGYINAIITWACVCGLHAEARTINSCKKSNRSGRTEEPKNNKFPDIHIHMYYVHTYIYVHIVFVLENHVKFSLLLC